MGTPQVRNQGAGGQKDGALGLRKEEGTGEAPKPEKA